MAEKTEKATPKKLRDARKKGQVAKSQDLPSAFTFIVSMALVSGMSGFMYRYLGGFLTSTFELVKQKEDILMVLPALFYQAIYVIFLASIPIMGMVAAIGVIVNFLSVGPVFATEVFKFDIKKFDIVQNLKAKFKLKTLVELLKSCIKITVACYIIYLVVLKSLPTLTQTVSLPIASALLIFNAFLLEVMIKVGLFFIIIAVLDMAYQKYNFGKEMMMDKFEVKQEYKNTEGDPQIKSKRRQNAQEIAYSEGAMGGVQRSRAVVTNPTHYAIAIGYKREIDPAPYILAKGTGFIAQQMIKHAESLGIPLVRNVPLAHKLWRDGEAYEYVPEDTYEALAEILRWVESLEADKEDDVEVEYKGSKLDMEQ